MLETLTKHLADRGDLTVEEIQGAVAHLIDEAIAAETKADFLVALAQKGETAAEIAAFAAALTRVGPFLVAGFFSGLS